MRGLGVAAQPSPLYAVPNITAHPLTASVSTSCCLTCHYNCLCTLKMSALTKFTVDLQSLRVTILTQSSLLSRSVVEDHPSSARRCADGRPRAGSTCHLMPFTVVRRHFVEMSRNCVFSVNIICISNKANYCRRQSELLDFLQIRNQPLPAFAFDN